MLHISNESLDEKLSEAIQLQNYSQAARYIDLYKKRYMFNYPRYIGPFYGKGLTGLLGVLVLAAAEASHGYTAKHQRSYPK